MDLQLVGIAVAIVVVIVILLLAFLLCGARERSFEEVYGDQKAALFQDTGPSKKDAAKTKGPKKHKETKSKTKEKVPKEDAEVEKEGVASTSRDDDQVQPSENAEDQSEWTSGAGKSGVRNRKGKKGKPEKREPSVEEDTIVPKVVIPLGPSDEHPQDPEVTSESFTEEQTELLEARESEEPPEEKENVPDVTRKSKKKKGKAKTTTTTTTQQDSKAHGDQQTLIVVQEEQLTADNASPSEPDIDVLIERLRETSLKDADLSTVVECLLMKQEHQEQVTKGAAEMNKLKKELADKENALRTELKTVQECNQMVKQCRAEADTEKNRAAAMEGAFRTELTGLKAENEKLKADCARLTQTANQNFQQNQQYQGQVHQLQIQIQQITQELNTWKQRYDQVTNEHYQEKQRLQMELNTARQQAHVSEEGRREIEVTLKHTQHTQAASPKQDNKQLQEVQQKLAAKEEEAKRAEKHFAEMKHEFAELEKSVKKLREDKKETERKLEDSQHQLKSFKEKSPPKPDPKLTEEVETVRKELKEAVAAKEKLTKELGDSGKKREELEKGLKELESVVEKERKVRIGLEETQKETEKKMEEREKELGSRVEDLEKLEKELGRRIEDLEKERDRLLQTEGEAESSRHKELETVLNAKNRLEADVVELRNQLNSASEKGNSLEGQLNDMATQLEASKNHYAQLNDQLTASKERCSGFEKELQDVVEELQASKKNIGDLEKSQEKLMVDVQEAVMQRKAAEAEVQNLKLELDVAQQTAVTMNGVQDNEAKLRCDYNSLSAELLKVSQALQTSENVVENKNRELANLKAEAQNRDRELQDVSVSLRKAQLSNAENISKLRELRENQASEKESAFLKSKIDELRTRNIDLFDVVQKTEKTAKDLLGKTEKECEQKLKKQDRLVRELLSKTFPDTPLPKGTENYKQWLHEVEQIVRTEVVDRQTHTHTETTVVKTDSGTIKENEQLRGEVSRYKGILSNLEGEMARWECRVLDEERRWKERCMGLQQELIKAQNEKTPETISVQQLKSTEEAAKDLQQVKAQLSQLSLKLESEEQERDRLREQVDVLHSELETERATGRDLSTQAVKLRGMLKTGQDALKQEQDLVNQLKIQLRTYQEKLGGDSGIVSPSTPEAKSLHEIGTGQASLHLELEQLKARLAEREQQLEKEMLVNKQLSNKLTSLGMTS